MVIGDYFEFYFYAADNPLSEGPGGVERLARVVGEHAGALTPERIHVGGESYPFSIEEVLRLFSRKGAKRPQSLTLNRESGPQVTYRFSFLGGAKPPGLWLFMLVPFSYFDAAGASVGAASEFVSFARALASEFPADCGWGHSQADLSLGENPLRTDPYAPRKVYEVYWLNLYGEAMLKKLGRSRALSTPAYRLEELPSGGMLLLTGPTPKDYASEDARLAQANALAHLRRDIGPEEALARLRARGAALAPAPRRWERDIEDLLELTMEMVPYEQRGQRTLELNEYRPPEVGEWRPAGDVLKTDVEDAGVVAGEYSDEYAEQLVMLLHDKVPGVMRANAEVLPAIDYYFWRNDYPGRFGRKDIDEKLIPAV